MKIRTRFFLILLTTAMITACPDPGRSDGTDPVPQEGRISASIMHDGTDWHAGHLQDGTGIRGVIWQDTAQKEQITSEEFSSFKALLSWNNQLTAGGYRGSGLIRFASIFVDGSWFDLTDGSADESVTALAEAEDGTLIACGYVTAEGIRRACIWTTETASPSDLNSSTTFTQTLLPGFEGSGIMDSGIRSITRRGNRTVYGGFIKPDDGLYYPVIWENGEAFRLYETGSDGGKQVPKASVEAVEFTGDGTLLAAGFMKLPVGNGKWRSAAWDIEKSSAGSAPENLTHYNMTDGSSASRTYSMVRAASGEWVLGGYHYYDTPEWFATLWYERSENAPRTAVGGGSMEGVIFSLIDAGDELLGGGYLYRVLDGRLKETPAVFSSLGSDSMKAPDNHFILMQDRILERF